MAAQSVICLINTSSLICGMSVTPARIIQQRYVVEVLLSFE